MNFIALDVETANNSRDSICQIGIVQYQKGEIINEWSTLINPEVKFGVIQSGIHGIDEYDVQDAPTYPDIIGNLRTMIEGQTVVYHSGSQFDKSAIEKASVKYGIKVLSCTWLDSALMVRRTWPQFSQKGYGLKPMCKFLGYSDFAHHDALADAKACGFITLKALEVSNIPIGDWVPKNRKSITPRTKKTREGNPSGTLYGEVIVFTGKLTMTRLEAANIASKIGCKVGASVTKKTTMIVVGDQDINVLAGHKKTAKLCRAEELIEKGAALRILGESEFNNLVALQG